MNETSDIPYLESLREELVRGVGRSNQRRRRTLVAARGAAVLVAVTGAAIVGLTVFGAAGPQTETANGAILHRVATALASPAGTILHEQAVVTIQGMAPATYELWQESDSPYAYRVIKFGHEASWNGSVLATYDSSRNTIVDQPGSPSSNSAYAPDDQATQLRTLVASGGASIDADTTFHGVPAYKLTVTGASSPFLNGTVYVAKSNYHPLQIQTTLSGKTHPSTSDRSANKGAYHTTAKSPGSPLPETIDFQTYEYLPATSANLQLLDLQAQHPGAQVIGVGTTATTTTSG
jgi:hypothetical protein